MNTLVELIALVSEEGKKELKFSNLNYFKQIIGSPELNYYTFDFKEMQKNDLEIRKYIIESVKNEENYEIIKDNIERAKIFSRPSNAAEMIFNNYIISSNIPLEEVNDDLIVSYRKMGFVGNEFG